LIDISIYRYVTHSFWQALYFSVHIFPTYISILSS